ncbi:MAG: hypothetical protein HY860_00575 [Chlamydiales bacterium]|nr:hypothetical protein [Chlamydiales bacterium]
MSKKNSFVSLSQKYKTQQYTLSEEEKEIYLTVRMPATAAVIEFVLEELFKRAPDEQIQSLLDLGAGPGTSLKALQALGVSLEDVDLVERDNHLIELGKTLFPLFSNKYKQQDITQRLPFLPKDIVLFSYSFNEIPLDKQVFVIEEAFKLAKQFLVVIEPGTPKGYDNIIKIRDIGLRLGGRVLAPCPHEKKCPLLAGDWCHFSVRLNRTSEHRKLKQGSLSYEDEKFSYVILSKEPFERCKERVLRHPIHRKGLVEMKLCTENGIQNKIFTKSNNENFKTIKKKEWGGEIS